MPWVECPECGGVYRRLPAKAPCPECGTPVLIEDHRLHRSVNSHRWAAVISGIILAAGLVVLAAWEADVLDTPFVPISVVGAALVVAGLLGVLWARVQMWLER